MGKKKENENCQQFEIIYCHYNDEYFIFYLCQINDFNKFREKIFQVNLQLFPSFNNF